MFEITPDDCARLDDKQLRELVGLLCEAELRQRGLPVNGVTWGGDQNAPDGGLDVRVSLPPRTPTEGFLPRPSVGFQVKRQDMRPAAIKKEMRPDGNLREAIEELAAEDGAYIIVSSQGAVADGTLKNRRKALRDAVADASNGSRLWLDFYDRTHLASWVRTHPGITLWVRQRIGRAMPGWQPFGAWAYPAGGQEAAFLLDDSIRILKRPGAADGAMDAEAGLTAIRQILAEPQKVIRLVGLSGVGKTRLAQALFDHRIGVAALDPALAIYANMNDAPAPQPVELASNLIADGRGAILLIDNCGADLHRRLSDVVKQPASRLSVLTIEYDIRDDQPEGTEVFEIQAASIDLTGRLLRDRFPNLSPVDAHTAALEAGGNARIAIALAGTVERSGTLSGLSDDDIFQRLFIQRHAEDRSLLEMAQVLSLVYSYQGEELGDAEAGELHRLGSIISASSDELFRATSELLDRDLAQRRGVWRAILPHALANRLAAVALRRIAFPRIHQAIIVDGPERLAKSLARRLGYLHHSAEARAIVEAWFAPDGWFSNAWGLNALGKAIFSDVLPVAPAAGLALIERTLPAVSEDGKLSDDCSYIRRALRSLAYDPELFGRCLAILEFLCLYADDRGAQEATKTHASLFHLYLSGTMAPPELRFEATKRLLCSDDPRLNKLGTAAVAALLEGMHFHGHDDFSFGAHSRGFGYQPRNGAEVARWFDGIFLLIDELRGHPVAKDLRIALADKFRGIWSHSWARPGLERACLDIARGGFWREGWLAVKMTRFFDEKDKDGDGFKRLTALEAALRPDGLVQTVRGRVLSRRGGRYDLDAFEEEDEGAADYQKALERRGLTAEALGETVARDQTALRELLPDLFSCEGELWQFGRGLAGGAADIDAMWQKLVNGFAACESSAANVNVLRGFLNGMETNHHPLLNNYLDAAVSSDPLAAYFPFLQTAVDLDARSVGRLLRAIALGKASAWAFENLAFGRATDTFDGADLAAILQALLTMPDGLGVATHILEMRLYSDKGAKRPIAPALMEIGRSILARTRFTKGSQRGDHALCDIAEICLAGPDGIATTVTLCDNLRTAVAACEAYGFEHSQLLQCLFEVQPATVLDTYLTGDQDSVKHGVQLFNDACSHHPNPLDAIDDETLITWCEKDRGARYLAAVEVISLSGSDVNGTPELSSIAHRLVQRAPDREAMIRSLSRRCRPSSWSGSRAAIVETNARLLGQIDVAGDRELGEVIRAEIAALMKDAEASRKWEFGETI